MQKQKLKTDQFLQNYFQKSITHDFSQAFNSRLGITTKPEPHLLKNESDNYDKMERKQLIYIHI